MGSWKTRSTLGIALLVLLIVLVSVLIRSSYIREDGTLLLRYDPYYHYRMAETIIEQGHRPEWDSMASWPTGEPVNHPPLYHYFLAGTFMLFGRLVDNNLLAWCSYSCIIPVVVVAILAFFTGKELTGTVGGLFCALLFGLTASVVRRTIIGFADTDGFILIFSLFASLFWIKSIKSSQKLLYSALAGVTVFLFELTWVGYWHLLFLLMGTSVMWFIIHFFMEKEIDLSLIAGLLLAFLIPHSFYSHLFVEGLILTGTAVVLFAAYRFEKRQQIVILASIIVCAFFLYSEGFISIPIRQLGITESVAEQSVYYPDVGPYISQRQEVTVTLLLENFATALLLAPVGLIILLRTQEEKNYNIFIFLGLYMVGGAIMSLTGVRFLLLVSVPILLSSSIALSFLWEKVARDSPGKKTLAVLAVILLFVPVYITADHIKSAGEPIPKEWLEALTWIDQNTPTECVVISDWGNGYWIESIARRKSIMNGGHYDLYWRILKFGKMMHTTDEETAVKEVFGFDTVSDVEGIRHFPEGEKGQELMELEMTSFALPDQEAYLVLGSRDVLLFDIVTYFGTWDYTTGTGASIQSVASTPVGTAYQPQWKQHLFNTFEFQVAVYEAGGEYHSFVMRKNSIIPTEGTLYVKDGETYLLKREKGSLGVAWYYSDSLMMFVPSDLINTMMVRLYCFDGDGLGYFELVAEFGTVKVYKIHREFQEDLNEGVIEKEDTWYPA